MDVLKLTGPIPVYKILAAGESAPTEFSYTPMHDSDVIRTEGATLRVIATPGHTDDHASFLLQEELSVFSGDCVLGAGSTTFADLHTYMQSLHKLLVFTPTRIYPGHGPVVKDGTAKIAEYIAHRIQREQQVCGVLRRAYPVALSAAEVVASIYTDTPSNLLAAAERNVVLHLRKLEKDGVVVATSTAASAADESSAKVVWILASTV